MAEETYKEINDCRPQVIEHFVGQKQVVIDSTIVQAVAIEEAGSKSRGDRGASG